MLLFINKRKGGHYTDAAIAKTSLTLPTKSSAHNLQFFFFFALSSERKSPNSINEPLKRNHWKMSMTAASLSSVTSHLMQPQKLCKAAAYGINLLENGGLFYKIQPEMCVQLWSLLGRSRCFHSFIQDLLEDVSFCSSWLDLGEEWGGKFLPEHTDYRMCFSCSCTYSMALHPTQGLTIKCSKASALKTR